MTQHKATLMQVRVLGTNDQIILLCVLPNEWIICCIQVNVTYVNRIMKKITKKPYKFWRQVLIKEQFHAAGTVSNLLSRSAAKAMQALKSARVRSGKSSRI